MSFLRDQQRNARVSSRATCVSLVYPHSTPLCYPTCAILICTHSVFACVPSLEYGVLWPHIPLPAVFCNLNLQLHQHGELHANFVHIGYRPCSICSSLIRPPTR